MDSAENDQTPNEEEVSYSKKEVFDYLLAVGVNSCYRSYDSDSKEFYKQFVNLPLKDILPAWERYDNTVKTNIIDNNIDDLRLWIDSRGGLQ